MIKCNKNEVVIKGTTTTILAEASLLISDIYQTLVDDLGEKIAKEHMEIVWEAAFLTEKELEEKNEELEKLLPEELRQVAHILVDAFSNIKIEEDK